MKGLLKRIAGSNGNPQRTMAALRMFNNCLGRELSQRQPGLKAEQCANLQRRLRTITALRLLNTCMERELNRCQAHPKAQQCANLQRRLLLTKRNVTTFRQTPNSTNKPGQRQIELKENHSPA